jgi:hypothetical protein
MPNEHGARITDPGKFDKIRRQNNKFGEGIHAIFGVLPDGKTELQAIRFDKDKFTAEEAQKWLEDHDYGKAKFEAAAGKDQPKDTVTDQKAGRVLSAANEQHIREAMNCHKEVFDLGSDHASRSCRALVKEAHQHLDTVVKALGDEKPMEASTDVLVKTAMADFLAHATAEDRQRLHKLLDTMEQQEKSAALAQAYRSFVCDV